ncbi:sensor histidine kinase [Actinoplanes sp. RD1]|uniref:sensor histidine kinase n=1 Tax=Actinoplanes sp. RD1 TaxID=3064538 RepID=UPI002741FDC8|nr:sensor histidine kinase [Actinoplanes sp. RD1]
MTAGSRLRQIDIGVAGALFLVLTLLVIVTPEGPRGPLGFGAAIALAGVQAGSVVLMRRRPEAAMAVAVAAGAGLEVLSPGIGWLGQASAVLACYARLRPPRRSLWVLALLSGSAVLELLTGDGLTETLLAAAGPALGWTLGELARTRDLRRQEERQRILAQERTRIARELHDVLAHTISVIVVQAQAAEDVFDRRPEHARKALTTIGTAARGTLQELRVLLQTLSDESEGTGPQPGLAQLPELAASLGTTGLRVDLRAEPVRLPPAVDLSAYRIVQESLTNTLRHSQATRARVTVSCTGAAVSVEVSDDGPARVQGRVAGSRHGLIGMRERARLLGGTFDAGPTATGGFLVRADLPLEAAA